tara:strand:- start:108 stop:266 length:159 start_codon:yes stop_codon:yes gene_type:complete
MRRFKSIVQAQKFVATQAAIYNLFNLARSKVSVEQFRNLRESAFDVWENTVI